MAIAASIKNINKEYQIEEFSPVLTNSDAQHQLVMKYDDEAAIHCQ